MKRMIALVCLSILLFSPWGAVCEQEQPNGQVAQVTTDKGLLNVRKQATELSNVVDRLSSGTLVLVLEEGDDFCKVSFGDKEGYAMTKFLTIVHVPQEALSYRLLKKDDTGDEVMALKQRLLDLGYYRESSGMTNVYNDTCVDRVKIFQRMHGLQEDGIATQTLQYLLFSSEAKANTEPLPQPRKVVGFTYAGGEGFDWDKFVADNPGICTCCMGAGCSCCNYTGKKQ